MWKGGELQAQKVDMVEEIRERTLAGIELT